MNTAKKAQITFQASLDRAFYFLNQVDDLVGSSFPSFDSAYENFSSIPSSHQRNRRTIATKTKKRGWKRELAAVTERERILQSNHR